MELGFLQALIVSLSMGAMIGLIRQWADQHGEHKPEPVAGLRTFALWAVLGYLSAHISAEHYPFFYPVAFGVHGLFLITSRLGDQRAEAGLGLTTYAIAVLTFFIGSLIYWGQVQVAVVLTATIVIVVAIKPYTHRWTEQLTQQDIHSILQFLAVTGVVLPLVPNQGYGPLNAFNPYNIWLMVVLISGLGFVGYIAMRLIGARAGILVTGFAGGLASSTATTLALTRNSKSTPDLAPTLASGILVANTVMLARVGVIIFAIDNTLALPVAIGLTIMGLPTLLFIGVQALRLRRANTEVDQPEIRNPLSLKTAIKFALLYAIIVFVVTAVNEYGGGRGFYLVAFVSGLTDMDAIALSLTNLFGDGSMPIDQATRGILTAAVANTLFKMGFALIFGSAQLRKAIAIGMGAMIVAGVVAIFVV